MLVARALLDVIAEGFLRQTIERLSAQLRRNINLDIDIYLEGDKMRRHISSPFVDGLPELKGEVRISASPTAVPGRYKYQLQCIFVKQEELKGFSGVRLRGAAVISEDASRNEYSGFAYTYNEWNWGKMFRNL